MADLDRSSVLRVRGAVAAIRLGTGERIVGPITRPLISVTFTIAPCGWPIGEVREVSVNEITGATAFEGERWSEYLEIRKRQRAAWAEKGELDAPR